MPKLDLQTRLQRIDLLASYIADGEVHRVADLADALQASERTLARDLAFLRERGWAIEGEAGPGGGIRLQPRARVAGVHLPQDEAIELLIALAVSEAVGAGFLNRIGALRAALARNFAPADRSRIAQLRRRVLVTAPAGPTVAATQRSESSANRARFWQAFFEMRRIAFDYTDVRSNETRRDVEPHYLLLAWPFWYAICWDSMRNAVRTFRLDRMRACVPQSERFRLKPAATFDDALRGIELASI